MNKCKRLSLQYHIASMVLKATLNKYMNQIIISGRGSNYDKKFDQ